MGARALRPSKLAEFTSKFNSERMVGVRSVVATGEWILVLSGISEGARMSQGTRRASSKGILS